MEEQFIGKNHHRKNLWSLTFLIIIVILLTLFYFSKKIPPSSAPKESDQTAAAATSLENFVETIDIPSYADSL